MEIEVGFSNGRGSPCDPILRQMRGLFEGTFSSPSMKHIYGESRLLCFLRESVPGSCHKRGAIIPKHTDGKYLKVVAQPGDDSTCWEVLVSVPAGMSVQVAEALELAFADKLSEEVREARNAVEMQLAAYRDELDTLLSRIRSGPFTKVESLH